MWEAEHRCNNSMCIAFRGQLEKIGFLLLCEGPKDQTHVVWLGSNHLYPMNHPTSRFYNCLPSFTFFFFLILFCLFGFRDRISLFSPGLLGAWITCLPPHTRHLLFFKLTMLTRLIHIGAGIRKTFFYCQTMLHCLEMPCVFF